MKVIILFLFVIAILISCTKKIGKDPTLAYGDMAMLDSINLTGSYYYQNSSALLQPAGNSPHGAFKLRFNTIGFNGLTSGGKLPVGGVMPNGSLIIKDVYDGGSISYHAFMYKRSGSWIWGEIKPNKKILFSVDRNSSVCTGCHSQVGNRDLVTSFNLH